MKIKKGCLICGTTKGVGMTYGYSQCTSCYKKYGGRKTMNIIEANLKKGVYSEYNKNWRKKK